MIDDIIVDIIKSGVNIDKLSTEQKDTVLKVLTGTYDTSSTVKVVQRPKPVVEEEPSELEEAAEESSEEETVEEESDITDDNDEEPIPTKKPTVKGIKGWFGRLNFWVKLVIGGIIALLFLLLIFSPATIGLTFLPWAHVSNATYVPGQLCANKIAQDCSGTTTPEQCCSLTYDSSKECAFDGITKYSACKYWTTVPRTGQTYSGSGPLKINPPIVPLPYGDLTPTRDY